MSGIFNGSQGLPDWAPGYVPPQTSVASPTVDVNAGSQFALPTVNPGVFGLANMSSANLATGNGGGGLFSNIQWLGNSATGQQGAAGTAIGAASALMNGYLGFKQLSLAKDTLAQNKRQFDLNFGAQQKMTNSRLMDRQNARVAANSTAYQDTSSYMKQYGI